MNIIQYENDQSIYVWTGSVGQIMVSFEDDNKQTLHSFNTVDDTINYLYLTGYKETARTVNKQKNLQ